MNKCFGLAKDFYLELIRQRNHIRQVGDDLPIACKFI